MRTIHVITGLTDGGAEAVLYRLCRSDKHNEHVVVSLREEGKYGPMIRALGRQVICLNMLPGRIRVAGVFRLWQIIKEQRPDVVQTWMYHGDLVGGVVARMAGIRKVVWGVHHTTLDQEKSKRSTILVARICARLSHFVPRKIIFCAGSASRIHEALGYDGAKFVVVNNGYDLAEFQPDEDSGRAVRNELQIPAGSRLLGMIGRFDPQKDHENLLKALRMVHGMGYDCHCLLVGRGLSQENEHLKAQIRELELTDRVHLLGQRSDVPAIMNALDLNVLSSAYGEAFPNVLAEAMACGTPCVATDVGDTKVIVGDTGWVVPAKDSEALAEGLIEALTALGDEEAWQGRGKDCRQRIQRHFSVEAMVERYREVWRSAS